MNTKAKSFLRELMSKSTPSGYEQPGQKVVAAYMGTQGARVHTDVHGNVHGVLNPEGEVRVMLSGHCDEIGLMVMHIDEKGFLYFASVGGVNVSLLQGERITLHSAKGTVPGVIGVKPIHLMDPKERDGKNFKVHELWIDIGAKDRKAAEKLVSVGDVATVSSGWIELSGSRVACRGFDDRIGAFIVSDVLRRLKDRSLRVAVHAVSSVQEEIGLRGARTAAYAVDPAIGIAVDVGFATDQPDVDPKRVGEASLGNGPILHCGPNFNPQVLKDLKAAAKTLKKKTQMQPIARGSGTDANIIQLNRSGVAAGLISIPTRYMHSPVEIVDMNDVTDSVELIAEYIASLKGNEVLIP